jgi:CheY-like chemotaxis protein
VFGAMYSRRFSGKGQPPPRPCGASASEHDAGEEVGRIRKVLVVDDEPDVADMAEVLLTAHGLDTVVAYSGADALSTLAAHPDIDAVVSDVMMPGMTGLQLAEQIDQRYPKVKIVLASGYIAPDMHQGQPLKRLFLAKPYRIEQLLQLLRT